MYKIVPAERQECSEEAITKNHCKPSKNGLQRSFLAPPAGFEPVACRLGGDRSIQLSYGGLYRKYSILQGSRIRTIRFLGGDRSIQLSYGGLYRKYSLLQGSRIRTIRFLGGVRSIQLSYRGMDPIFRCTAEASILSATAAYCIPFCRRCQCKKGARLTPCSFSICRMRITSRRTWPSASAGADSDPWRPPRCA